MSKYGWNTSWASGNSRNLGYLDAGFVVERLRQVFPRGCQPFAVSAPKMQWNHKGRLGTIKHSLSDTRMQTGKGKITHKYPTKARRI